MDPGDYCFSGVDVEELAGKLSELLVGRYRDKVMPACRKIAGALKALPTSDQRAELLCSIIERQLVLLEDGDELLEDGGRAFGFLKRRDPPFGASGLSGPPEERYVCGRGGSP